MITEQTCWSKVTPSVAMQIVSNGFVKVVSETNTSRVIECDNCFIKTELNIDLHLANTYLKYFKQDK